MALLEAIIAWFDRTFGAAPVPPPMFPTPAQTPPEAPKPPVVPVIQPSPPKPPMYDFSTPQASFHSTRVICDEEGLTYAQKNIVCECIYQESTFLNYRSPGVPVTNGNKDKTGKVWSTDFGICQVNDYFNIGPGKPFASVNYVMQHPDEVVRWMVRIMKKTGKLQPWSSYTTGAYKKWDAPTSKMWILKI